jgi:hypothetical protein
LQKTGWKIAVQCPSHSADKSDARKRIDRCKNGAHIGSDPHKAEQKEGQGNYKPK